MPACQRTEVISSTVASEFDDSTGFTSSQFVVEILARLKPYLAHHHHHSHPLYSGIPLNKDTPDKAIHSSLQATGLPFHPEHVFLVQTNRLTIREKCFRRRFVDHRLYIVNTWLCTMFGNIFLCNYVLNRDKF